MLSAVRSLEHHSSFIDRPIPVVWMLLATLCLYSFAISELMFPKVANTFEALTVLNGLLILFWAGLRLRFSTVTACLLIAIILPAITWGLALFNHPEFADPYPKLDRTAKWFMFLPVAVILAGSTKNTLLLWLVAACALLASSFIVAGGIDEWLRGWHGERVGFGTRNPQHAALLMGLVFIGLIAFAGRIFSIARYAPVMRILWLVAILVFGLGVIITQTRAIWLGVVLAISLMIVMFVFMGLSRGQGRINLKVISLILVMVSVLLIAATYFLGDMVKTRAITEKNVIVQLFKGDVKDVPFSSIGVRIHTWNTAFDAIAQRPIMGWGGNAEDHLIDADKRLPDWVRENFGHMHNSYIHILLTYGLVGFVFFAGVLLWLVYGSYQAYKANVLPADFVYFGSGALIFWLVVNVSESYIIFSTGTYLMSIIVGGFFTHYLQWYYSRQSLA